MDAISYSYADKQAKRIKKFINDPDSTSGVLTVPKVIASGENITIPAGRVAVLPNVQVDGTLNIEGEVFIPSGATFSKVVETEGNQTIAGVKTFSSSPIVPTPTAGTQVANKEYVDTKVSKDGTGATGTWGINITGNATTATTATNFVNSSNVTGNSSISAGTGDGASRTTYNVKFKSWHGTAYADNTDTVNRVLDHRTGIFYSASGSSFLPEYACRAWVNFNGQETVAIRASGNVSSITDRGTGLYTVNLSTAMPDVNYASVLGLSSAGADDDRAGACYNISTSAIGVSTSDSRAADNDFVDAYWVHLAVFR